ncbi:SusD/RagB family nutrient-binding outer membrane lipoprotein [Salmonirosea aquatica]|uniref:SusD/RagB family nutrient-binding outer membrane lipoprotein n=1 Tax=Salmonirosea aquatica TaxID=2654236 RepID=A0A7C9FPA4_9BACT|nr:SusD/RagB family nutrient-binding outer membrane lipoprotein [Cytophagaceae bacterium SJW1-29]
MKKLPIYLALATCLFATSCDKGFDEMNTNKTAATTVNPVFLLNNAVINASFPSPILWYDMSIVQQTVTPNSGVLTGANFNQDNRDYTQQIWLRYYPDVIRNTKTTIDLASKDPARSNLVNMTRIWQAHAFMVLTDTYGDIPYFDAGVGFINQVVLPKYDPQEAIYKDIIKELKEASAALDASKPKENADIMYAGDIAKWKKLGYSLLLRAGMRLTEVDPTLAQQTVKDAVQGGLIESNADNAVVRHNANYNNALGSTLNGTEGNNIYLGAPFVNYLKSTNDPRLGSIAVRYVGATSGPQQIPANAKTDPSVQIGMPFGFDNISIKEQATKDGLASFYAYSQIDRTRLAKQQSPMFLVTYGMNQLLLAEAATRGWVVGSAEDYYKKGVRAHMEQMALYDVNSAIPSSAIDAYLAANPFDASKALEQINTQYWIATFMNGPESFANWRRSNFPKLTPNPFPGKSIKGNFINRLTYPNSEVSVNSANLKEAVGRMGADDLDTKVWWDK